MKYCLLIFLIGISQVSHAQSARDYARTLERRGTVNDFGELLSPLEEEKLAQQLNVVSKEVGLAFSICIIENLRGFTIEKLAGEIGNNWQSGASSSNYGILFLISKKEKEVFVATSEKVRLRLPDSTVQAIVDKEIIPQLKNGRYYMGLSRGAYELEKSYNQYSKNNESNGLMNVISVIFMVTLILLLIRDQYKLGRFDSKIRGHRIRGNSRSGLLTGPDNSGDFSGGGDSSGAGDSFGGGGAGGSFGGDGGGDSSD